MPYSTVIEKVIAAQSCQRHLRNRLKVAIQSDAKVFLVEEAADYHRCPFGCKTLGMPYMERAQPEVEAAILIHSAFHIAASKVARKLALGQHAAAKQIFDGEFADLSRDLTVALNRWKAVAFAPKVAQPVQIMPRVAAAAAR